MKLTPTSGSPTTRLDGTDRRTAVFWTESLQGFSEPEFTLQCHVLSGPLTEPYGMTLIPFEGTYVGLLWLAVVRSRR